MPMQKVSSNIVFKWDGKTITYQDFSMLLMWTAQPAKENLCRSVMVVVMGRYFAKKMVELSGEKSSF